MIRVLSAVLCVAAASPAFADAAKEKDCGYQGDVVAAVQAARVARVGERNAPEWPEKYNAVVPLVAPWIYGMPMADVKTADLSAAWQELCLTQ